MKRFVTRALLRTALYRGQLPNHPAILLKRKGHSRVRQGRQGQVMLDVRRLGFLSPEELPARGQIEEKLSRLDARARSRACGLHLNDLTSANDDSRALGRISVAFA